MRSCIARLKGNDPLVFVDGIGEMALLQKNSVKIEVSVRRLWINLHRTTVMICGIFNVPLDKHRISQINLGGGEFRLSRECAAVM